MSSPSAFGSLVHMLLGPIVWVGHLAAIYAAHWWPCALDARSSAVADLALPHLLIIAATTVALTLLAVMIGKPDIVAHISKSAGWPTELAAFLSRATRLLAILSAYATAAGGAASLAIPVCTSLR